MMKSTAKQLRGEATWPPEAGEVISFKSSTSPFGHELLTITRSQPSEIGILLQVRPRPPGSATSKITRPVSV